MTNKHFLLKFIRAQFSLGARRKANLVARNRVRRAMQANARFEEDAIINWPTASEPHIVGLQSFAVPRFAHRNGRPRAETETAVSGRDAEIHSIRDFQQIAIKYCVFWK